MCFDQQRQMMEPLQLPDSIAIFRNFFKPAVVGLLTYVVLLAPSSDWKSTFSALLYSFNPLPSFDIIINALNIHDLTILYIVNLVLKSLHIANLVSKNTLII